MTQKGTVVNEELIENVVAPDLFTPFSVDGLISTSESETFILAGILRAKTSTWREFCPSLKRPPQVNMVLVQG